MNNRESGIPCEMIRDLLPNYIEELTSHVTNEKIEEHLNECPECSAALRTMRSFDGGDHPIELHDTERKELSFLKKTRKRSLLMAMLSALAVALIAIITVFSIRYFIGFNMKLDLDSWEITVEDSWMELYYRQTNPALNVSDFRVTTDENGIVQVDYKCVLDSFLTPTQANIIYETEENEPKIPIKEVWLKDELIWAEGHRITQTVWDTENARHPYLGDMPANSATANALRVSQRFGSFTNELETSGDRMVWRIIFDKKRDASDWIEDMTGVGFAMLATIDNLDEVEFRWYLPEGEADSEEFRSVIVRKEDALNYTDQNVKDAVNSPGALAELLEHYGIYN